MALTLDYVTRLFENLSNGKTNAFFDRVVDDVHWTVMGTHPLAGVYNSKADFLNHTFVPRQGSKRRICGNEAGSHLRFR